MQFSSAFSYFLPPRFKYFHQFVVCIFEKITESESWKEYVLLAWHYSSELQSTSTFQLFHMLSLMRIVVAFLSPNSQDWGAPRKCANLLFLHDFKKSVFCIFNYFKKFRDPDIVCSPC
jgi:hypothetical protein